MSAASSSGIPRSWMFWRVVIDHANVAVGLHFVCVEAHELRARDAVRQAKTHHELPGRTLEAREHPIPFHAEVYVIFFDFFVVELPRANRGSELVHVIPGLGSVLLELELLDLVALLLGSLHGRLRQVGRAGAAVH